MNNKSAVYPCRKDSGFHHLCINPLSEWINQNGGTFSWALALSLVNNNNDLKHICSYAMPANPYRATRDNGSLALLFYILVAGHTKQSLPILHSHTRKDLLIERNTRKKNRNHVQFTIEQSTLVSSTKLRLYYPCFNGESKTSWCKLKVCQTWWLDIIEGRQWSRVKKVTFLRVTWVSFNSE